MKVITRFAPSPTGLLHIGSARVALFNWLFARHYHGKFLLRIEDTDFERSTPEAITAIINGMQWLGLDYDGDIIYQAKRNKRHFEVAHALLANGHAYKCYSTTEEIAKFREQNPGQKFRSPWRDADISSIPEDAPFVVRLKANLVGETAIDDLVQGEVRVSNDQLDDMVLLRSDGTPTYMLAVVVDDHDMEITHVIRGDDHLTNTFRQLQLYKALNWQPPKFAHISLVHGEDGSKLSKRHGAVGVDSYKEQGYLPAALKNYLLRLGWNWQDKEIINMEEAIANFDIKDVNKAAVRFDMAKLNFINSQYLREMADEELLSIIENKLTLTSRSLESIRKGMPGLKERAQTLSEIVELAKIYIEKCNPIDDQSARVLSDDDVEEIVNAITSALGNVSNWEITEIKKALEGVAAEKRIKFGRIMQITRAAVIGSFASPGIVEVMWALGKSKTLNRINEENEQQISQVNESLPSVTLSESDDKTNKARVTHD
jgi:glutamyl-tRNA synthetase